MYAIYTTMCGHHHQHATQISAGVAISAYGELHFVLVGILLQLASIATESTRLCLTQILLQDSGLKLTPITMLYYVAPCSVVFLLLPFAFIEAPTVLLALSRALAQQ